jgi:hypothetical protein
VRLQLFVLGPKPKHKTEEIMENQSIVEKIKKLLSLANRAQGNDGTSNEAEAASAMAKVQELLAKYNLDMHAVTDSVSTKSAVDAMGPREEVKINRSAMYRWQQTFWSELAELNYCFHWVTTVYEQKPKGGTRKIKRHVVLGSAANVAAVLAMGEYLTEVMERELPYPNVERLSNAAISWREGCAERLIERLKDKVATMKREGFKAEDGSQVTALAVQDLHEKEYAANYDARWGAGSYARMKKRNAEWEAKAAEAAKTARDEREKMLGSETPEQRAKREKAEAKAEAKARAQWAKDSERYWRRQQREAERRNIAAYSRGVHKAESVNLDSQIKGGK